MPKLHDLLMSSPYLHNVEASLTLSECCVPQNKGAFRIYFELATLNCVRTKTCNLLRGGSGLKEIVPKIKKLPTSVVSHKLFADAVL